MKVVAKYRGGQCLSSSMTQGDLASKLKWSCCFGHEFVASPTLILLGGHWCPKCSLPPWNYGAIAEKNPFFAQVWHSNHDKKERSFYSADCYKDINSV